MTPKQSIEKLNILSEQILTAAWLDWENCHIEEKFTPDIRKKLDRIDRAITVHERRIEAEKDREREKG